MKYAVILIVVVWLLCGVAGAWMLHDLNRDHWKTVLRGPMTLVRAINDNPVTVGPD
jgi:hypothetical protein